MIFPLVSAVWMISVEPMFSLYETLKPLASRACLYSSPRMYSSEKFLVPITIVGAAWVDDRAVPANPPRTIATPNEMAKAALAALRVCFLITAPPC